MNEFENTPFETVEEEIEHCLKIRDSLRHQDEMVADKEAKNDARLKKLGWKDPNQTKEHVYDAARYSAMVANKMYADAYASHANQIANQEAYHRAMAGAQQQIGIGNALGGAAWGGIFGGIYK